MASSITWGTVPGFDPVEAKFIPLDVERWLRDHGIAEDAEARGAEDLPSSNATSLGDQETKIVQWINSRALDCRQQVSKYLQDLRQSLVDIEDDAGLKILVQQAEETRDAAVIELAHQVDSDLGALDALEDDLHLARDDFNEFRNREGISRPPNDVHRKWAFVTILICCGVETALNATLLMDVNVFGLVGSIAQMGLISAVNILIGGLAMGALVRQAHLRSPVRKALAWCAMAATLAAVVTFNLAVGHFRDSLRAALSDPSADIYTLGNDALVRLADGPFQLDSFQSALLALLGMLFFGVASWKWLQRDDPYPGYGQRKRDLDKSRNRYADRHHSALAELRKIYTDREAKLQDIRDRLEVRQGRWEEIRLQGQNVRNSYSLHMKQYQLHLDSLLSRWRTINMDHRSTPPPAYFETNVLIDPDLLFAPDFDPPESVSLATVMDTVHGAISQLQRTYAARAAKYLSLSTVLRRGGASPG